MKDDDIEILDLDEQIIYPQKEVTIVQNKETKIKESQVNEIKKKNIDKKLRKGEKIFVIFSVLFIIGSLAYYGYRTYYYYHLTHDVVKNTTLKEKLTSLNNIVYQNDGLYEKNGYFYYKGVNVNNYVYYSGRLFRIIDINDGIRMIEDETLTNLVWTIESNYEESIIHKWLADYLITLKDYDIYLKKNKWCNEQVDIEDYKCDEVIDEYVGLISTSDYLQAGGKASYLNNGTYFWTLNQDKEGKPIYINNEGNINNIYKKDSNYFSYGVRPVITLNEDIEIISGDGSIDNPFIIQELGNALLKDNSVGSYVKYNDDTYRILNTSEDGISLIYEGVLEIDKKYDDVINYLNNEFLKKYDKKELVTNSYYVNEYSINNKYNIVGKNNKKNYVIIPKIGDMFLNSYSDYWLNNYSDSKLGLYYTLDDNKMLFADLKNNLHKIRPIIKLNIETVVLSGLGMKNKPLVIGEEGDNNA